MDISINGLTWTDSGNPGALNGIGYVIAVTNDTDPPILDGEQFRVTDWVYTNGNTPIFPGGVGTAEHTGVNENYVAISSNRTDLTQSIALPSSIADINLDAIADPQDGFFQGVISSDNFGNGNLGIGGFGDPLFKRWIIRYDIDPSSFTLAIQP
jgi:hypothetical protein